MKQAAVARYSYVAAVVLLLPFLQTCHGQPRNAWVPLNNMPFNIDKARQRRPGDLKKPSVFQASADLLHSSNRPNKVQLAK